MTKINCLGLFGETVAKEDIKNLREECLFLYYGNLHQGYDYAAQMGYNEE